MCVVKYKKGDGGDGPDRKSLAGISPDLLTFLHFYRLNKDVTFMIHDFIIFTVVPLSDSSLLIPSYFLLRSQHFSIFNYLFLHTHVSTLSLFFFYTYVWTDLSFQLQSESAAS